MTDQQELRSIPQRARLIARHIIKFIVSCIEWALTTVIAVVLGIAAAFVKTATVVYRTRSKIIGILLLACILTLLLLAASQFIGFKGFTDNLHRWLTSNYHWAFALGITSATSLAAWNYLSPTLRTIFGTYWVRTSVSLLVGAALVAVSFADLPHDDIAYRSRYAGIAILYVTVLAVIAKTRRPKKIEWSESFYIDDNPEATDAEPYETQKRVISDIEYLLGGSKPSAFAITGHWGVGKTFLLHRAKKRIEQNNTIICMNFEPWRYASEEALIRGFYQDIGTALTKIPGIQHIARPLAETTDKFVRRHDGTGLFGAMVDGVRAFTKSPESPEDQIQGLLSREGKRLIVVIDDVERSFDTERIFRTLQLAHFTKNMNNVQVVFLFDKDVILRSRPDHFGGTSSDPNEYLEKFVPREVFVPSPRPSELRQHFASLMETRQSSPGFDFSGDDLSDEMLNAIGTPRGIIRLYNELAVFRRNLSENDK